MSYRSQHPIECSCGANPFPRKIHRPHQSTFRDFVHTVIVIQCVNVYAPRHSACKQCFENAVECFSQCYTAQRLSLLRSLLACLPKSDIDSLLIVITHRVLAPLDQIRIVSEFVVQRVVLIVNCFARVITTTLDSINKVEAQLPSDQFHLRRRMIETLS